MNDSITVGAFEAKTKFSELLERVSGGAEITITRHERPVAKLVPFEKGVKVEMEEVFRQMAAFASTHTLNPRGAPKISYRELIEGGRKR